VGQKGCFHAASRLLHAAVYNIKTAALGEVDRSTSHLRFSQFLSLFAFKSFKNNKVFGWIVSSL
jgi:hypothetical protein